MAVNKRLLLINPPPDPDLGSILSLEHLGLGYVAASVRNRPENDVQVGIWDCAIIDPSMERIPGLLEAFRPDFVGLTLSSMNANQGAALASDLKRRLPGLKIILGGVLTSTLPDDELAMFKPDAIIRGEGERLIVTAMEALECREPAPDAPPLAFSQTKPLDVDELPWPDRAMLPWQLRRHPQASLSASRGCPYHCGFCSIPQPGTVRRWRPREIEDVVEEMARIHKDYGAAHFYFVDDNFLLNTNASMARTERFAKLVLDHLPNIRFGFMCRSEAIQRPLFRLLKKAGLSGVFLGVESFSQPVLDRYKKKETVEEHVRAIALLDGLGLTINPGYIFFDPWTSPSEINDVVGVAPRVSFPVLQCVNSKLTCYRGTAIEKDIPNPEFSASRPGVKNYSFVNGDTERLFKKCRTLFYATLPRIEEYAAFQQYNYCLGYLQPYCQNGKYERLFKKYYDGCQAQWKLGDLAVLQWIRRYGNGEIEDFGGVDRMIHAQALPHWRNGNILAERFLDVSRSFLPELFTESDASKARLTALAFTTPYPGLDARALVARLPEIPPENRPVLAEVLAFGAAENPQELFQALFAAGDEATAMAALRSALFLDCPEAVGMAEEAFAARGASMSPAMAERVERVRMLFARGDLGRALGFEELFGTAHGPAVRSASDQQALGMAQAPREPAAGAR